MTAEGANSKTIEVLTLVGITRIYWIDDQFRKALPPKEVLIERVKADLKAQRQLLGGLAGLHETVQSSMDEHVMGSAIGEYLDDSSRSGHEYDDLAAEYWRGQEFRSTLFDSLGGILEKKTLHRMDFLEWQTQKDSLPVQPDVLYLVDLENRYAEDGIDGHDVLKHLTIAKPPAGAAGVAGAVSDLDSHPFHIVLTHECDADDELTKCEDLAKTLGLTAASKHRLSVMSKRRLSDGEAPDIDARFSRPLTRLASRWVSQSLIDVCHSGMEKGLRDARDTLAELPFAYINRSLFERSWTEGASEVDVVQRIFSVAQRSGVSQAIRDKLKDGKGNFFPKLSKLRELHDGRPDGDPDKVDARLAKWAKEEIFDDQEFINGLHLPLACGDIFQKRVGSDYTGRRFMLLAAPCDLVVRGETGERSAREGIFVELKAQSGQSIVRESSAPEALAKTTAAAMETLVPTGIDKETASGASQVDQVVVAAIFEPTAGGGEAASAIALPVTPTGDVGGRSSIEEHKRKYEIAPNFGGESLFAHFMQAFTVNLSVLDFCVADPQGRVMLKLSGFRAPGVLQPGWKSRLESAVSKCRASVKIDKNEGGDPEKMEAREEKRFPPEYRTLCLFADGFLEVREQDGKNGEVDFQLKRVGRLRTPYAEAALAAYLQDLGRPGFDHSFS